MPPHLQAPSPSDPPQPRPWNCVECATESTPVRRGGPSGPATLCNACGLRMAKRNRVHGTVFIQNGRGRKRMGNLGKPEKEKKEGKRKRGRKGKKEEQKLKLEKEKMEKEKMEREIIEIKKKKEEQQLERKEREEEQKVKRELEQLERLKREEDANRLELERRRIHQVRTIELEQKRRRQLEEQTRREDQRKRIEQEETSRRLDLERRSNILRIQVEQRLTEQRRREERENLEREIAQSQNHQHLIATAFMQQTYRTAPDLYNTVSTPYEPTTNNFPPTHVFPPANQYSSTPLPYPLHTTYLDSPPPEHHTTLAPETSPSLPLQQQPNSIFDMALFAPSFHSDAEVFSEQDRVEAGRVIDGVMEQGSTGPHYAADHAAAHMPEFAPEQEEHHDEHHDDEHHDEEHDDEEHDDEEHDDEEHEHEEEIVPVVTGNVPCSRSLSSKHPPHEARAPPNPHRVLGATEIKDMDPEVVRANAPGMVDELEDRLRVQNRTLAQLENVSALLEKRSNAVREQMLHAKQEIANLSNDVARIRGVCSGAQQQ